ncbi:HupE/UreJ family protein [Labedella endophytica]|uniref:HupE/UreJ family protein n=1 Tax=Labedella endophytica TaxID=1523160 RepID=A0A433JU88_9MICO|nr:HupE/UreJ family protein [Labedella endophytica]RUR01739.1 HupE/UreJ family protein [Labedella endophytica]
MPSPRSRRHRVPVLIAGSAAVGAAILSGVGVGATPASAHGISSVVYAELSEGQAAGHVGVELQLEYDLFVVSAADAEQVDPLFQDGTEAWEYGDADEQAAALDAYADTALAYVSDRFTVSSGTERCELAQVGGYDITEQQGVPYAILTLDAACADGDEIAVTSTLFPDDELYVVGTETILTYDVRGSSGSAVIDADNPEFSVGQSLPERLWEFFVLGGEHLLFGIDHILFLLALIAGSRRLREIVVAATAFTVAHSITFILAALQIFTLPADVIEPIIALSIAVVAAWPLFRIWRRKRDADADADALSPTSGPLGIDRGGWIRLAIVFLFGLIHGMGFASALGIDEAWSWSLLGSLLVFNVGIEAVQVAIILVVFPLLALLRRRSPRVALWVSGLLSAGVAVFGLVWFVQRIFGWE